ncbi:MAG TPA: hypothetical protein VD858_15815, partial [Reyranella sp.]|nr:hypothetical protein [Reyranella sp.]
MGGRQFVADADPAAKVRALRLAAAPSNDANNANDANDMLPIRRTAATVSAGLIVLGLLAGCGSGSDAVEPASPIAAAPPPAAPAAAPAAADVQPDSQAPVRRAVASGNIVYEKRAAGSRVWAANQDNDSVTVIDATSLARIAEIPVGRNPRALALDRDGRLWVSNRGSDSLSIVDTATLKVARTIVLPRASRPFGIVFSPADGAPWVVLEAIGRVARLEPANGTITATIAVGPNPRHLSMPADGRRLLVSRFVSPPLPGEATATPEPKVGGVEHGGEVVVADATSLAVLKTIVLKVSDRQDSSLQGRGIPNYLGAAVIAPDGLSAWVPSKQDNVMRGTRRDGQPLDFQTTVRAISSRIVLGDSLAEDNDLRVDHDNSGVATAAAFEPTGTYLFVALETSRHVAVVEPANGREVFRFASGKAPQGLVVSDDGKRLFVNNFMDRTVAAFDIGRLLEQEQVIAIGSTPAVATERLSAQVLKGKQFFYDAADPKLARDGYISCASCHADGGSDGRTWDFTGFGEGLRRTISLRGRAAGSLPMHWSGNFDEAQDFEAQIREFAGGSGLMDDDDFVLLRDPLGTSKAGVSADLDALAAYMASLDSHEPSPHRNADGSLTTAAAEGKNLFAGRGCLACHGGPGFSGSDGQLHDVGTLKPTSGGRLGGSLTGIDTPTLRDVWSSNSFLH